MTEKFLQLGQPLSTIHPIQKQTIMMKQKECFMNKLQESNLEGFMVKLHTLILIPGMKVIILISLIAISIKSNINIINIIINISISLQKGTHQKVKVMECIY